jgi:hypothetical protein
VRKLLIGLVTLAVLLVAADRVAVKVADGQVATRLRDYGRLQTTPSVQVRGFPFLTQALGGRYDHIDVEATDLSRGGVRLDRLDVSLLGARVPLNDALGGKVHAVPVEGLKATAVVRYLDLAGRSGITGLRVEPQGNRLAVTGRITMLGQTVTATAVSSVRLSGQSLVVTAESVKALGPAPAALDRAIDGLLDFRVPIGTLPYGLELTSLRVTSSGIVLVASSGPTVLTTRSG